MRRNIAIGVMITGSIFSIVIVTLFVNLVLSFDKEQLYDSFWSLVIGSSIFILVLIIVRLPGVRKGTQKLIVGISNRVLKGK